MGQYYRIVNLDRREWFSPDQFDETAKLPAQCPRTMRALGELLMTSRFPRGGFEDDGTAFGPVPNGRWCGERVVILGDEAVTGAADGISFARLYELLDERDGGWTNVGEELGGSRWLYEDDAP